MYYVFTLVSVAVQERGVVGYRELPDLLHDFKSLARNHGAEVSELEDGSLVAVKGSMTITLSIDTTEEAFPSRRLLTCMEEMMDRCFGLF